MKDLVGQVFGRLTVIRYEGGGRQLCRCECGEERALKTNALLCGNTRSCGCLRAEMVSARRKKHGESTGTRSVEYTTWSSMIERCHNPNSPTYQRYGAKGVSVCDRWRNSFENFLADMKRRPAPEYSLDRFPDQLGNYEPWNVRWATDSEQARNRKSNVFLEFNGRLATIAEWSEITGIPSWSISQRIKRGWPVEKALAA